MATTDIQSVFQRDRRIVLFSIFIVVALAWIYLVVAARGMGAAMPAPRGETWAPTDFILMYVMWAVMMLGMMLPSASPMIMMFAKINRGHSGTKGHSPTLVPVWIFIAGYAVIWSAFSLAATVAQWALQYAGLLSPTMASTDVIFGSSVLIAAGLYQWTPLKHTCLKNCQTPLGFLMTRWRDDKVGAFHMGLAHGAYCVGCCWVLMGLLFVAGVMNLLWVAVLAIFVLSEKVTPPGPWLPRLTGTALVAWGGFVLTQA
jgi:predicted metal-binding membrane protein